MGTKGLTLLEIVVSIVILSLITVGIGSLFVIGKREIQHSRSKISAAELAKQALDPLQMSVTQTETAPGNADGWDGGNNKLKDGNSYSEDKTLTFSNGRQVIFNTAYTMSDVTEDTFLRKAKVTITWQEPAP